MSTINDDKLVYIKARAFTGDKIRLNKCLVDSDGTVRVWDSVANSFTACHILSKAAVTRCRKATHNSVA